MSSNVDSIIIIRKAMYVNRGVVVISDYIYVTRNRKIKESCETE